MALQQALCPVLVGRDEELADLERALLDADRGDGAAVILAGDAGMGKTRLCSELRARATRLGWTVLAGGCAEAELSLPYLPFVEALGVHLRTMNVDALRAHMGDSVAELARIFPRLGQVPAGGDTDPAHARLRLFEAMLDLLRLLASESCVLLVVEDAHWADTSTRELLDFLVRQVRGQPLMLLVTYRRDEMHRRHPLLPIVQGWRRSGAVTAVELQPLGPRQVEEMMCAIFDESRVSDEFLTLMHQRSEGNPFVLEEMLKEAIDRGDLYRTDTGWDRRDIAQIRIPQTVADSILLRIERLDPDHQEVLRAASVLGRTFRTDTLVTIAGLIEPVVIAGLDACVREQLLEHVEGSRFRFRHALTREAVYEDIVPPLRGRIHGRVADVVAQDPDTPAVERALHLLAAERWDDAVTACVDAAAHAAAQQAHGDAADLLERAIPLVSDPARRGDLLCRLGTAYHDSGHAPRAIPVLEEGVGLLEDAGHTVEAASGRLLLGRCHWELLDADSGRREYEAALRVLEPAGPSRDLAIALIRLAGMHVFALEYELSGPLLDRAAEVAAAAGADDARIWTMCFAVHLVDAADDPDEGFAVMDRGFREAVALGRTDIAGNAVYNSAVTRIVYMRAADARAILAECRSRISANGRIWLGWLASMSGLVDGVLGDLASGIENCRHVIAAAADADHPMLQQRNGAALAWMLAETGELEEASRLVQGIDVGRERQDLLYFAPTVTRVRLAAGMVEDAARIAERVALEDEYLGRLAEPVMAAVEAFVAAGRLDDARDLLERAARRLRPDDPRLLAATGRVALADGDADTAAAALERAVALFAERSYALDAMRCQVMLARAIGSRREAAAVALLDDVRAEAGRRGAHLIRREATTALAALGRPVVAEDGAAASQADVQVTGEDDAVPGVGAVHATPNGARDAVEGRPAERLVSVLFADVRGYTAMGASASPADLAERIAALQRWATQEVRRHRGVLDKFAGDAVMATFNAAGASVDHCDHAVDAALAIVERAALGGLPVGAAVAVGPAVVGHLAEGANLSVLGEVTNLAARLQAEAQAGEVVLSDEAARRAGHRLRARGLEPVEERLTLKGFAAPVTAWRVAARRPSGGRPARPAT